MHIFFASFFSFLAVQNTNLEKNEKKIEKVLKHRNSPQMLVGWYLFAQFLIFHGTLKVEQDTS